MLPRTTSSSELFHIWSFCFANPLISLRVTRVTLSFKLHDYAFSAMIRNNHPDQLCEGLEREGLGLWTILTVVARPIPASQSNPIQLRFYSEFLRKNLADGVSAAVIARSWWAVKFPWRIPWWLSSANSIMVKAKIIPGLPWVFI